MRVGVDLIEIERVRRALERYPHFRERCFTAAEQAYFYTEGGQRTALFFFDLKQASDVVYIAEPGFLELNADMTFTPVMNGDELKAGLVKAGR